MTVWGSPRTAGTGGMHPLRASARAGSISHGHSGRTMSNIESMLSAARSLRRQRGEPK